MKRDCPKVTDGRSFWAPHKLILFLLVMGELSLNQLFEVNHLVALESIVVRINESFGRIFRFFLVFQVSVSPKLRYVDHIECKHITQIIAKKWSIISTMHYSTQRQWKNNIIITYIINSFVSNEKMEKIHGFCSILQPFKNR